MRASRRIDYRVKVQVQPKTADAGLPAVVSLTATHSPSEIARVDVSTVLEAVEAIVAQRSAAWQSKVIAEPQVPFAISAVTFAPSVAEALQRKSLSVPESYGTVALSSEEK